MLSNDYKWPIPMYDAYNQSHKYAWDVLAFELTDEDYQAIQTALMEREEEHEEINKTTRDFRMFDHGSDVMMQPRKVTEDEREAAHRYVDWDCGLKIWLIMSKYARLFSKL